MFERFSIGRGNPRFWSAYDWFQRRFDAEEPITAGAYDLNRYRSRASGPAGQKDWLDRIRTR